MGNLFESVLPAIVPSPKQWPMRLRLLVGTLVTVTGLWCVQSYSTLHQSPSIVIHTLPVTDTQTSEHIHTPSAPTLHANIKTSLYNAVVDAGLDPSLAIRLRDIFGGEVDFRRDLRPGDWFTVVYAPDASSVIDGGKGKIAAAEISVQGQVLRAFLFQDGKTGGSYYTATGKSLHQSILRAPLNYNHISSPFSYHRLDPVSHVIRPHYGVDYAAPVGTPVEAAANGRIHFIGRDAGYGNLIVISSFGKYQTYYAHLKRFVPGLHAGSRVQQGERIGYVGESGEATGPHLHFGIKVDGVWRNPRTVPLPDAAPLPHAELVAFQLEISPLLAELHGHDVPDVQLATAVNPTPGTPSNAKDTVRNQVVQAR